MKKFINHKIIECPWCKSKAVRFVLDEKVSYSSYNLYQCNTEGCETIFGVKDNDLMCIMQGNPQKVLISSN